MQAGNCILAGYATGSCPILSKLHQAFNYVKAQPPAVIGYGYYAIAQPQTDKSPKHIEDLTTVLFKVIRQLLDDADIAYRAWRMGRRSHISV